MEFEKRSSGTAKAGLATGVVGTALGALNSLALVGAGVNAANNGGYNRSNETVVAMPMMGGCMPYAGYGYGYPGYAYNGYAAGGCCSEDHFVNRYEAQLQHTIGEKDSQLALKDAIMSQDTKMLEMYKYVDGRLRDVEANLARQAVVNQKTEDSFVLAQKDLDCCCKRLENGIAEERRERQCEDRAIITYTNATFYPKNVADISILNTTTPQKTYNPLTRDCDCR